MTNQRVLTVPGGINFRELGGYSTKDGRKIKWHKVIRTGGLDQLTPLAKLYWMTMGSVMISTFVPHKKS